MTSVVENIHQAVIDLAWHRNVMIGDPELSKSQAQQVLANWQHDTILSRLNTGLARIVMHVACAWNMRKVKVYGLENLPVDHRAIVVSNHFAPLENLAVRKALGNHRLFIVSELTNLAMKGGLGWLMRHADTIPIAADTHYMGREFIPQLQTRLHKAPVLIYPEQALWLNYRKPRPGQRGAYYFAAQLQVPVISMFVAINAQGEYAVHILKTLNPDSTLSARAASLKMLAADDLQRQAAFEAIYQTPYDLLWHEADIVN
ncbi:lysophospholipid acyltransferase family protein [Lacticaseibacillus porcinae]|uniref:lysophospholipid acyltransferase family protein n=1 Tax=Lacticaseibacillus porcinae TaxID=1123687 RepID=UPI000F7841A1|nr:lysophospholipid acyltransferase family protein [Lacticaseibacillus porcinae]